MNRTNFTFCSNDTIAEIQSCFSRFYPNWVINFFSNNEKNQPNDSCVMFSPEVRVQDISLYYGDGCIEFSDDMTTEDLEKSIHEYFGLHVEISPRNRNQTNTVHQKLARSSNNNNPERIRLPERSDVVYFKNVPFGC
jgi:hypothetical protein